MSQLSGIGRTLGKRKSGLNWFIRSLGEGGVGRGFHSLSHLKLDKEKNKVKNSYLKMWGGTSGDNRSKEDGRTRWKEVERDNIIP